MSGTTINYGFKTPVLGESDSAEDVTNNLDAIDTVLHSHEIATTGKHGVGGLYIAKTSRSDQFVPWNEIYGTPLSFNPSGHQISHHSGQTDALSASAIGAVNFGLSPEAGVNVDTLIFPAAGYVVGTSPYWQQLESQVFVTSGSGVLPGRVTITFLAPITFYINIGGTTTTLGFRLSVYEDSVFKGSTPESLHGVFGDEIGPQRTLTVAGAIEGLNPASQYTITLEAHSSLGTNASYPLDVSDLTAIVFESTTSGIDQQQLVFNNGWGIMGTNYLAQSFVLTSGISLPKISLPLSSFGPVDANLNVEIRTDNLNQPSSTVLATRSYNYSQIGSTNPIGAWFDIVFDRAINYLIGTKYWIVARADGVTVNNYFWGYAGDGNPYSLGNLARSSNSGVTWTLSSVGEDAAFKIYTL